MASLQAQLDDDHAWALTHPDHVRYAGQVIVVHRHRVVASGDSLLAAWQNALATENCPPQEEASFVVVPLPVADPGNEFAWCLECEITQREFGGLVAVVKDRQVLAAGVDRATAWAACRARTDCPSVEEVRFVLIPALEPQLI
jgi:hypothetical protein